MALLALTQTSSGSSFSLDEKNVLKIYNNGSKNIVEYLDVVKGLKKQMEVDETPAAIFALADNMVSTTLGGATIYLNADRVTTVDELNSLAVVKYDEGTELSVTLNLDVDKSTFEAGMPTPGGGLSYVVYRALLSQSGTSAPVATVLENTLGNVSFIYDGTGAYFATSDGLFVAGKTTVTLQTGQPTVTGAVEISDASNIELITFNVPTLLQENDNLSSDKSYIEIRVYN